MNDIQRYFLEDRIKTAKSRMNDLYHLKDTSDYCYRIIEYGRAQFSVGELSTEPEKLLLHQLSDFELCSRYEGDYIPVICPVGHVVGIPSAFGCEIIQPEDKGAWVKPLIKAPSDVYKLKKPKVIDGLLGKALEATRYLQKKTGGFYPIRMLNIQGPITNASTIWKDQDFLLALYDYPKEIHALLDIITELMIDFVKAQKALVSDFVPILSYPDWIPDGYGIGVADDYAAVLSPALYEEFALPYNNRLSREFGGIAIHSCGRSEGIWDVILKHENLRAVNFELPDNSFEKMVEKFSGKALIAPHAPFRKKKYKRTIDMVQHMLNVKRDDTALLITLEKDPIRPGEPFYEEDTGFSEAYELLRRK